MKMQTCHLLMNLLCHQFSHQLISFLVGLLFDVVFDFILMFAFNSGMIIFGLGYYLLICLLFNVVWFKYYSFSVIIMLLHFIDSTA